MDPFYIEYKARSFQGCLGFLLVSFLAAAFTFGTLMFGLLATDAAAWKKDGVALVIFGSFFGLSTLFLLYSCLHFILLFLTTIFSASPFQKVSSAGIRPAYLVPVGKFVWKMLKKSPFMRIVGM
jgi:hypothetical protein